MTALPPVPADDIAHVLDAAGADLRALAGSRIFITGGTGFIGTWLLESIAAANAKLNTGISSVLLTRSPQAFARRSPHLAHLPGVSCLAGDVRDFTPPTGAFDHIIHGATPASAALNESAPREMFSIIVDGTARVLDFAERTGADHLLLSSGAVYGPQPAELARIPETYGGAPDPLAPTSAYAEGKRAAEVLCATTPRVASRIARCFAFVGPHLPLDAHFAAGNFIRDALRGTPIIIKGDGRPLRSYLHAADLVVWLLAILVRGTLLRPYNVGSDNATSIAELAHCVARQEQTSSPVHILAEDGQGPAPRYVPDTRRAANELDLRQLIDLNDAVARTLRWHRLQP